MCNAGWRILPTCSGRGALCVVAALALMGACPFSTPCLAGGVSKVVGNDSTAGDKFGTSVALDDKVAVVGARWNNELGENAGAAYVFRRHASAWEQIAKLTASDGTAFSRMGQSVDVDGTFIVVGAPRTDGMDTDTGAAYVFEDTKAGWVEVDSLTASDPARLDRFGTTVAIEDDVIVVGSRRDDDACPLDPDCDSGAAYVFHRTVSDWVQLVKLTASDAAAGDEFSDAVSIGGGVIVVGSSLRDDACDSDPECNSGAAYVFTHDGNAWAEVAKLTASDAEPGDWFGAAGKGKAAAPGSGSFKGWTAGGSFVQPLASPRSTSSSSPRTGGSTCERDVGGWAPHEIVMWGVGERSRMPWPPGTVWRLRGARKSAVTQLERWLACRSGSNQG